MTQPDLPDWISATALADAPQLVQLFLSQAVPFASGSSDVSPYQSVQLAINSASATIDKVLNIVVTWFDTTNQVWKDTFTVWGSHVANQTTDFVMITMPCRGDKVSVAVTSNDATVSFSYFIYGSKRIVPRTLILADPAKDDPAVLVIPSQVIGAGATVNFFVGPVPVGYAFTFSSNAAGPVVVTVNGQVVDNGTFRATLLDSFNVGAATLLRPIEYCPNMALQFILNNSGGAATTVQGTVTKLVP